ncbi:MAG: hypothetical protein PHR06_11070 [Candidatus Cloacimonetes bacterium]|nr:hypothetical protein [Candidatus Cloacimonadota bacterium]
MSLQNVKNDVSALLEQRRKELSFVKNAKFPELNDYLPKVAKEKEQEKRQAKFDEIDKTLKLRLDRLVAEFTTESNKAESDYLKDISGVSSLAYFADSIGQDLNTANSLLTDMAYTMDTAELLSDPGNKVFQLVLKRQLSEGIIKKDDPEVKKSLNIGKISSIKSDLDWIKNSLDKLRNSLSDKTLQL